MQPGRVLLLCLAAAQVVFAQAGSDYFSYPRAYTPFGEMLRDSRQLTFNRLPGISLDYRLSAEDVVIVEVLGMLEISQRMAIDNSGSIRIPLVGELQVEDLTAMELENLVAEKLIEKQLLKSPEVLVHVVEYAGKPFHMIGQIDRPGEYSMSQQLTLMDAILVAGGLDYTAGSHGYLHRRLPGADAEMAPANVLLRKPEVATPGTEVFEFDLEPLKRGGLFPENPVLQKGDVFVVPARPLSEFYVIGEVRLPGRYEMPAAETLYASQAIAYAGGPMKTAKTKQGVMIRIRDDGSRIELPIDFAKILKGEEEDFAIERNDVLFIPGSKSKNLGYGLLGQIPTAAQNSVNQGVGVR